MLSVLLLGQKRQERDMLGTQWVSMPLVAWQLKYTANLV